MGSVAVPTVSSRVAAEKGQHGQGPCSAKPKVSCFQMPLHYPRYTRADYQVMPEWKVDCLLTEYGLPLSGDLAHKRDFAMGAFLWPSH